MTKSRRHYETSILTVNEIGAFAVKMMGDHFRGVERSFHQLKVYERPSQGWNTLLGHACITHQDDMTKVDLPYFVESASADITRWRFDVNAHVSAVTNDAVVFSHDQGAGSKMPRR